MSFARWLRLRLFTVASREMQFARIGARVDADQAPALQAILESARLGFNVALEDDHVEDLTERVARAVEPDFVGFAHEGAGMCLALLDEIRDRRRVPRFFERCLGSYDFFVPLGVGFALARLPFVRGGIAARAARFPPVYDGLVLNGSGFHEACFRSGGALERTPRPRGLAAAASSFDHGIGRAMWFMCGGSPDRIAETLAKIDPGRHDDLWGGLGTACAFAGRAYPDAAAYGAVIARLQLLAGEHRPAFQVGVVLATELVKRTRRPSPWVDAAAKAVLGMDVAEAGHVFERAWAAVYADPAARQPFAAYNRFADLVLQEIRLRSVR